MRYDLAFLLCCCKSFLGNSSDSSDQAEDFYEVLCIDKDASSDEIKRAYKRQSLKNHPDKLAQRGQQVTDADQARFQRIKEAYEVCILYYYLQRERKLFAVLLFLRFSCIFFSEF